MGFADLDKDGNRHVSLEEWRQESRALQPHPHAPPQPSPPQHIDPLSKCPHIAATCSRPHLRCIACNPLPANARQLLTRITTPADGRLRGT